MVDVEVTILGSSLNKKGINIDYKVKSSWCHVNIEKGKSVRLPRLPLSHHYHCSLEETKTVVFLEFWYKEEINSPNDEPQFYGLAECSLTKQIQFPNLNPTVQWWDVYDPIRGINQGKVLLQIDAKLVISESNYSLPISKVNPEKITDGYHSKLSGASSYFPSRNVTEKESKCQEVQTDISLVLFQNNKTHNEILHSNYNASCADASNIIPFFASTTGISNFRRLNNVAIEDSNAKLNPRCFPNTITAKGKHLKNSDRGNSNKITAAHKEVLNESNEVSQSANQSKCASEFNNGFLDRSDSVENIISLLNSSRINKNFDSNYDLVNNSDPKNQSHSDCSSTLSQTQVFHKSGKDGYNNSKLLIDQGRLAPEGQNESDSNLKLHPNGPSVYSFKSVNAISSRKAKQIVSKASSSVMPLNDSSSTSSRASIRPKRMAAALFND